MTKLLSLTGISTVGKTSIAHEIIKKYRDSFCEAVAFTTRDKRDGEIDGQHYHFMKREEVLELKESGKIIRISDVHGHLYGHTKNEIDRIGETGKVGIVTPDLEGVKKYKNLEGEDFEIHSGLILPDNWVGLGRRIIERQKSGGFSREQMKERWRTGWDVFVKQGREEQIYDFEVVNQSEKLSKTVDDILQNIGFFE